MEKLYKIYSVCEKEMNFVIDRLNEEVSKIRIGSRSIVSFLERIKIKYYEKFVFIPEISNIIIVDNMNISIIPWDKKIISKICNAIIEENLGINPTNNGEKIHIKIPIITEESRKNLIKKVKKKAENSKIYIRQCRKKSNKNIKKLNLSKDLSKIGENKIQKKTSRYINYIEKIFLKKEKEILKI